MEKGSKFAVREGGRTVGAGVVTEVVLSRSCFRETGAKRYLSLLIVLDYLSGDSGAACFKCDREGAFETGEEITGDFLSE